MEEKSNKNRLCAKLSLHEFTLLGETVDDSPGEALDKCARMLGLHHLPGLRDVSGGRAIEITARFFADFISNSYQLVLT